MVNTDTCLFRELRQKGDDGNLFSLFGVVLLTGCLTTKVSLKINPHILSVFLGWTQEKLKLHYAIFWAREVDFSLPLYHFQSRNYRENTHTHFQKQETSLC